MTVFGNITLIIEIDEVILIYLPENSKCDNSNNKINYQFLSVGADIWLYLA